MPLQKLYELTPAESIFAPFHDERLSAALPLTLETKAARGFRRTPNWCSTIISWLECPPDQTVGTILMPLGEIPARFDQFTCCQVLPDGVRVSFFIICDGSEVALGEEQVGDGGRMEATLARPSGSIEAIGMEIVAGQGRVREVRLNWWGVTDSRLASALHAARPVYSGRWEGLILPREERPAPDFVRGLLFDATDLPDLRRKAKESTWSGHIETIAKRARESLHHDPLQDLGDFLPWSDYRYLRVHERGRAPWMAEPVLCALIGLLEEDQDLIDHALHYLMCFVHTRHWCQSAESRVRGCTWDQRCFLEEMATTTCALIYDWLGYALTDQGRRQVRYAIWDKGLSIIQRDMVAWEYLYTMNQGPWFCRARIFGGLVLEPDWPRSAPYVEQAFADLQEGMANYLLPDGGVDEGLGYFCVTLQAVIPAILAYARAREVDPGSILPENLRHSTDFVSTMSAMRPGCVLLDGDNSNEHFTGDTIAMLAKLLPEQVYPQIAAATLLQLRGATYYRQYMIDGPFAFIAGPEELPAPTSPVPVFARLPHTGHLTSRREVVPGHEMRLHLTGCKAYASHTHFDKGAITLELDQEPVLIDRGVTRYDDIRHLHMIRTEQHNVLAPATPEGDPIQQAAPQQAVIPDGEGDTRRLQASIDLSHVWREVMQKCRRTIESPHPGEIRIIDEGELRQPLPLTFHLHTRVPWKTQHDQRRASLEIGPWRLELHAPWAEKFTQREDGIDHRLEPVWHLECRAHPGSTHFHLETRIRVVVLT